MLTSSLSEEGGVGSFGGEGGGVGSLGGGVGSLGGGVGSRGSGGFTSAWTKRQHHRQKSDANNHTHTCTPARDVTFWSLLILFIHVLKSLVNGLRGEWHVSQEGSNHPCLLLGRQLQLSELPSCYKPSDHCTMGEPREGDSCRMGVGECCEQGGTQHITSRRWVHACVCISMCRCTHVHRCVCVHLYVCVCVCMLACVCARVCVRIMVTMCPGVLTHTFGS